MIIDIKIILLLSVALSALFYYAGFVKPTGLSYRAKAAFIVSTCILMPVCLIILWFQASAIDKLMTAGIVPHPEIVKPEFSFGLGSDASLAFVVRAASDSIFDFYRNEQNRRGWTLVSDTKQMMIFRRADKELVIFVEDEGVISKRSVFFNFHKYLQK